MEDIKNYVITPYYRSPSPKGNAPCFTEPDVNYTPYDIFCLQSRLSMHLLMTGNPYSVLIKSQEYEDAYYLCVFLNNEGKDVTKELLPSDFESTVKKILSYHPHHCAFKFGLLYFKFIYLSNGFEVFYLI